MRISDIIGGTKKRKHRNSRKHRIVQNNLYTVDASKLRESVGREYQHLEDLVFVKGSRGAMEAADILDNMGKDSSDVAIKWDGNPTVYYGREPDGTFVLVGKNGWGRNKSTSSEDLKNFIMSTGKGEDWRAEFADGMAAMFEIIKKDFPENFRGYVYGDLLYHPGKPFQTGKAITFTPNKVTYTVDPNSEIGKRIGQSKVGVTLHTVYPEFGSKTSEPIKDVSAFDSGDVFTIGQTYVTHQPTVDVAGTDSIRSLARKHGNDIDTFLAPVKGLSDLRNIIYTFVNQLVKTKNLDAINAKGFFNWLQNSKVSTNKQAKIVAMNESNPNALSAIFQLVNTVMAAKNNVIDQLDSAPADITATTGEERGGEGYVAQNSKTKLVPRHRWTPN
jgi:hypothetical protein